MIKILETKDNDDGSSDILFSMSNQEIMIFAKIGLEKVLLDAANKVIEEHENTVCLQKTIE